MAHFAEIDDNNVVVRVLVVDDLHESRGADYLANDLGLGGTWIKTSYNTFKGAHVNGGTPLRKNYAGIGMIYDFERDAFYAQQPFASWVLNEETCIWEAPITKPIDSNLYIWNEEILNWEKISE